jgi:hypothetical protein
MVNSARSLRYRATTGMPATCSARTRSPRRSSAGPDPDEHREAIAKFEQAGFSRVYIHQVGRDQEAFFHFYEREILPALQLVP